jgi:dTDP-4-dehydrorhamnose 3,5-epimerase-like enzyme
MDEPRIIDLPKILDPRGNLTFLQHPEQLPFEMKRVFWTFDVPGGEVRGGHAYKTQDEVLVALSGSFDVVITDVNGDLKKYSLNRSYKGLYIPAKNWRHIENFSTNAISLHLSSSEYEASDYEYDFEDYKILKTTL